MTEHIVHWDDVPGRRVERGAVRAFWTDLGTAAGTVTTGLRRVQVDPGARSTPVHVHGAEEEIFYVLGGSGLSWQDGRVYEVGEGDCLVHLAEGPAHTLIAGPEGLDVLAYGQRLSVEAAVLPRAHVAWLGPTWVTAGDGDHPWARELAAGDLEVPEPSPRPPSIASLADVPATEGGWHGFHQVSRDLGGTAGSRRIRMRHVELPPDKASFPLHCHPAEEEIFVVLGGEGVFVLGDAEHPVRAGHVLARPAGSGVAHLLRGGGFQGLVYLALGERDPNDVSWLPRSKKLFFRGLGIFARVETTTYWDGEE